MNKDKTTPDAEDQDLTRLFDAQQEQVPEALDKLILTAAKEAVAEPAVTGQKRRGTAIKSWFAVAATLLLGITLTPLLLQAPESALDRTASTGSTLKAVESSVSMTAESSLHVPQNSESDAADSIARDEASRSISRSLLPAIQAPSGTAVMTSNALARQKRVIEAEEYRRSPMSWVGQIRTLIKEKQLARARTEYELFRKSYPKFAPDFAPDFTLGAKPE